jgi:hypothetical protein
MSEITLSSKQITMTIFSLKNKTTGERFLSVDGGLLPIGIASMCADHRISGFEIKCTECRTKYPVRVSNEGGYCDECVAADFEE